MRIILTSKSAFAFDLQKSLVAKCVESVLKQQLENVSYFPGETWQSKVSRLRKKMAERKATVMVLSLLDDVACKLLFLLF